MSVHRMFLFEFAEPFHFYTSRNVFFSGCLRDFRNKPFAVRAKIEYYKNTLSVQFHNGMSNNDKDYEMCMRVENVVLPKFGYFGISAATGGLADDHDVLKFSVSSLRSPDMALASNDLNDPESKKFEAEFEQYQVKKISPFHWLIFFSVNSFRVSAHIIVSSASRGSKIQVFYSGFVFKSSFIIEDFFKSSFRVSLFNLLFQVKLQQQKDQWAKENPEEAKAHAKKAELDDWENWFSDQDKELQQIYQGQAAMREVLTDLQRKMDEIIGRQERTLSLISAVSGRIKSCYF